MSIIFFPGSQANLGSICVISLKACTEKTKNSRFNIENAYFFQFSVFCNPRVRHNPCIIELFCMGFLMSIRRH